MNGSDIEFEMLQKNGLISIAVKVFIGMLACYAVAGLDYVYFNFIDGSFGNDNPISLIKPS